METFITQYKTKNQKKQKKSRRIVYLLAVFKLLTFNLIKSLRKRRRSVTSVYSCYNRSVKLRKDKKDRNKMFLVDHISGKYYENLTIRPDFELYKLLCPEFINKIYRIKLNIPETVVLNSGNIVWMRTDSNGYVVRKELKEDWITKYVETIQSKYQDVVKPFAIIKVEDWKYPEKFRTNTINEREIYDILNDSQSGCLVQNFIPNRGQPNITRLVYNLGRPIQGWSISNISNPQKNKRKSLIESIVTSENIDNIKAYQVNENVIHEPAEQLRRVINHLEKHIYPGSLIKFTYFVGDFILDLTGVWFFIKIKAFKLDDESYHKISTLNLFQQNVEKTDFDDGAKPTFSGSSTFRANTAPKSYKYQGIHCKFCNVRYTTNSSSSLSFKSIGYKVSNSMLIKAYNFIRQYGYNTDWCNYYIATLDKSNSSIDINICNLCYELISHINKLIKYSKEFNSYLGISKSKKTYPDFHIYNDVMYKRIIEDIHQFRFAVLFHSLNSLDGRKAKLDNYTIKYNVFTREHDVHIGYETKPSSYHVLNQIRIHYVFGSTAAIHRELKKNGFSISISYKDKTISLPVSSIFKLTQNGETDARKLMVELIVTFSNIKYILKLTIGLIEDKSIKPYDEMIFRSAENLYYPYEGYTSANPLPEDWMYILGNTKSTYTGDMNQKNSDKSKKNDKCAPFDFIPKSFRSMYSRDIITNHKRKERRKEKLNWIYMQIKLNNQNVYTSQIVQYLNIHTSKIPCKSDPHIEFSDDSDPYLTYHFCTILKLDKEFLDALNEYELLNKPITFTEFWQYADTSFLNAQIGGSFSGQCMNRCPIHCLTPHYSSDLYCIKCANGEPPPKPEVIEKKPVPPPEEKPKRRISALANIQRRISELGTVNVNITDHDLNSKVKVFRVKNISFKDNSLVECPVEYLTITEQQPEEIMKYKSRYEEKLNIDEIDPFLLVSENDYFALEKYLLNGGNPNKCENLENKSLLHVATEVKNYEIVELLLTFNADKKQKDKRNKTPLDYAIQTKSKNFIKLLS